MSWEEVPQPRAAAGEIVIRHSAIGVNFIDVYQRSGLYKLPLPFTPGQEAAGVVEALGEGVTEFTVGDRVTYATAGHGAYAHKRLVAADKAIKLPAGIDDRTAAAMMLKGLTAQYLLLQIAHIQRGEPILFHAAAGGVGLIACQWAKQLGAVVIGTVGSDEKSTLARAHGCDHVIVYTKENFVDEVRALTNGKGVRVVFDGVGKTTFSGSLDCLAPRGLLISFGQSSGPVPPFDILTLSAKGSLSLTRPTLAHYAPTKENLCAMANDLFSVVQSGAVRIATPQTFALRDAPAAHAALEGRRTTGSTVLIP